MSVADTLDSNEEQLFAKIPLLFGKMFKYARTHVFPMSIHALIHCRTDTDWEYYTE